MPADRASRIAHELRRIEVLRAEDPVGFVHPLIRGSIYDAVPEAERQTAHRRAARLLDEHGAPIEAVAAHLIGLTPSGDVEVATTLRAAAERALDRAAPDEAVTWLQRALAEQAPSPSRADLLLRIGTATAIKRDPTSIAALQEAYGLVQDPELRGRVAIMLGEVLAHVGQWDAAVGVIESIEDDLGHVGIELRVEAAAIRAAITLHDPAHIEDFDGRRPESLRLSELDYWASYALAALLAVEAANRGRPQEALALAERARHGGRLLAERGAWINARRGDLAAADADLTTVFEFVRSADVLMGLTSASFLLVDVLLERENLSHIEAIPEQMELPPDFLATVSGAMLLEARGRLRLLHRNREQGIEDLRAAGRIISALRFGPLYSTWRSALALALSLEDRDEAHALAAEELELALATGLARPTGIALRTLGILGDTSEGIDLLRESVAVLEGSPARLEQARSLVALGSALRRANRRRDAQAPLVAGLRLAYLRAAHRLIERAEQELRASGGRRPRVITTGRDALTASDRRVVELAVAGATNTEIAQELYVSVKTVETHLSNAYVKLGLAGSGSRGRLVQVL